MILFPCNYQIIDCVNSIDNSDDDDDDDNTGSDSCGTAITARVNAVNYSLQLIDVDN